MFIMSYNGGPFAENNSDTLANTPEQYPKSQTDCIALAVNKRRSRREAIPAS